MSSRSLAEIAEEVHSRTSLLRESQSRQQLDKRIEDVASEFAEMGTGFEPISRFARECVHTGILDALPQVSAAFVERLRELAQMAELNPEAVVDADDLAALRVQANNVANSWGSTAREAWGAYCRRNVPPQQEAVLQLLEQLLDAPEEVGRLRQLDKQLAHLASSPPISQRGGPELLVKCIDERRRLWEGLDAEQIPADVMTFIDATAKGGASIHLLNGVVVEWLTNQGLAGGYKVVSGTTSE